jgi:formylglycine-generating enzyme required for sulfatase activity
MDYNPSNFHGYELPVEHVSWYDCIEFCNKLSLMGGFTPCYEIRKGEPDPNNNNKTDNIKWTVICNWEATGYRLPTEAEWEFAAKGGNNSNYFPFAGGDNVNNACWYKDNSQYKTHPVGQKTSNELGLFDMSGNVWEWVWDWYDAYKEEAFQNPRGPEIGAYRVLRGGSWADNPNYQRAAGRGKENPTGRYTSIGLRIVRGYFK